MHDLSQSVQRTYKCFIFAYAVNGKAVKDETDDGQHSRITQVIHQDGIRSNKLQVLLIEIGECNVGKCITKEQDVAYDRQAQLAHAMHIEHDTHETKQNNHDKQDAQCKRASTLVIGKKPLSRKREIAECGYCLIGTGKISHRRDKAYEREYGYQ